jgi:hypothetical protein
MMTRRVPNLHHTTTRSFRTACTVAWWSAGGATQGHPPFGGSKRRSRDGPAFVLARDERPLSGQASCVVDE